MKKFLALSCISFFVGASSVYAAVDPDTIFQNIVIEIFNPLYKAFVAIAFVYFLYGVLKYMHDLRNPQDKNTGKQHLLWGMIGLFIIFSVGGLLNFFASLFGPLGIS